MEGDKQALEALKDKLLLLTEEKYDKLLFRLRRNYIFGTFMVDLHSPVNITWDGPYSNELYPQHWLFHLLGVIKVKHKEVYKIICEVYNISESSLYNESMSNPRIDVSIDTLWLILMEVYNVLVTDQSQRIRVGVKVRKEMYSLEIERSKLIMEVTELISVFYKVVY